MLVGSLLPLVLLHVGTAVTSVLDAKLSLPIVSIFGRYRWPPGLWSRFAAVCLLRLWVRIPLEYGCFSVVNVACGEEEFSATSCSLVQRSPAEYGA